MKKVEFVVIDNNTFGYIQPENPQWVNILATSPIRGSTFLWTDGPIPLPRNNLRPAIRKDFDTFRISTNGYDTDPRYNFPTT